MNYCWPSSFRPYGVIKSQLSKTHFCWTHMNQCIWTSAKPMWFKHHMTLQWPFVSRISRFTLKKGQQCRKYFLVMWYDLCQNYIKPTKYNHFWTCLHRTKYDFLPNMSTKYKIWFVFQTILCLTGLPSMPRHSKSISTHNFFLNWSLSNFE